MRWPHERGFRGRAVFFAIVLVLTLLRIRAIPGLSIRDIGLGVLVACAASLGIYFYTVWVGRLDARFQHVHPRKIRGATVGGFYLFATLACVLLVAGPWLGSRVGHGSPSELMAWYFAVPCFLSAAAGAHRVLDVHLSRRDAT